MPSPAITGLRTPLNLPARSAYDPLRLILNLGVSDEAPTDPGELEPVIGSLVAVVSARWHRAARLDRQWVAAWGDLARKLAHASMTWGGAGVRARAWAPAWDSPHPERSHFSAAWSRGDDRVVRRLSSGWISPTLIGRGAALHWRRLEANAQRGLTTSWNAPPLIGRGADVAWHPGMRSVPVSRRVGYSAPPLQRADWHIRWGRGDGLPWFIRPPGPVEPPVEPSPFPDGLRVGLNLGCDVFAGDTRRLPLNLGISACWNARLQRRTYVVLNEISVVRLPDRLPIHVDAVSVDGGRDAAYWEAALTLADPTQLDALAPTVEGPRSIEITINGYAWVVQVEAFDSGQVFGATEVSLRARSVTAQLGDPYATPRTREEKRVRTMVQLADDEVAGSGFTVDYATVDWLVPAGAWYYEGLTPMAALVRIAEASGAVVQSHPTDPVIAIRPRYPVSPWSWTITTPDAVIQDDVVTGTRLQLQSRPVYDAVIVAGERVGVAAKVKRDGEAGQTFAPQQIDQLITHADGARERGRNVVSDRGGQALVEVDIPLFGGTLQAGQPGLVLPLMLVQRVTHAGTWHGLAAAVRIDARRQDKAIDVMQTVTLERHYTDAD